MTHAFIDSVALELLEKRRVGLDILPGREILSIVSVWPGRAIAPKLNAVHAKIFKIERVFLVDLHTTSFGDEINFM